MKLIERQYYLQQLIDVMNTSDIKVITGIRRSGKSKLMDAFIAYVQKQSEENNSLLRNTFPIIHKTTSTLHLINMFPQAAVNRPQVNLSMNIKTAIMIISVSFRLVTVGTLGNRTRARL